MLVLRMLEVECHGYNRATVSLSESVSKGSVTDVA